MYGKIGIPFCTLSTYHAVPDGPIFIYPSNVSINSASSGLFGDFAVFYVTLVLESECEGKYMPCVPGTATAWQLPATCGVPNC